MLNMKLKSGVRDRQTRWHKFHNTFLQILTLALRVSKLGTHRYSLYRQNGGLITVLLLHFMEGK